MKSATLFLLGGLILLASCSLAAESVEPTAEVAAVEATATFVPQTATAPPPEVITATDVSATTEPATIAPTATVAATDTPAEDDDPSAAVGGLSSAVIYGRTDDGAYFHGAADAPVTLIDYSDFL